MAGSSPDPNCSIIPSPSPAPGPPVGTCSGELRVRGSADGSHFLGVGFSCPEPRQPGNCFLKLRPVTPPDDRVNTQKRKHRSNHRATATVNSASANHHVDDGASGGVVVPFSRAAPFDGTFTLRVLVDTSVVEVYAQLGRAIETIQCFSWSSTLPNCYWLVGAHKLTASMYVLISSCTGQVHSTICRGC
eukprot:COSAG02_NODE_5701_length_4110_cov_2.049115_6_plen_189_part_00